MTISSPAFHAVTSRSARNEGLLKRRQLEQQRRGNLESSLMELQPWPCFFFFDSFGGWKGIFLVMRSSGPLRFFSLVRATSTARPCSGATCCRR